MQRDIEVAENVLSTLLRQQFDKQRMFFPLEVNADYQPGYGVTFRLPADFTTPIVFSIDRSNDFLAAPPVPPTKNVFSYSYEMDGEDEAEMERSMAEVEHHLKGMERQRKDIDHQRNSVVIKDKSIRIKDKTKLHSHADLDSLRDIYNGKMIDAAKSFLMDYADLISQLTPEERIIITNQGDQPRMWVGKLVNAPNRTHLSVEATKGDLTLYKQGKINMSQLESKIKVVNTESVTEVSPDLELLTSIFDRLYQPDLARTYFTHDRIYYERLKDYGVIYYMQVYSSNNEDYMHFSMPTLKLDNIDQEMRNKKVKEIYPQFETELKENILEYGRTIKSLEDHEVLAFNVRLTKCASCGIPSTLEISVKGSVLKDYASGKADKKTSFSKLMVKKGAEQ
jgi:hypothetical protein